MLSPPCFVSKGRVLPGSRQAVVPELPVQDRLGGGPVHTGAIGCHRCKASGQSSPWQAWDEGLLELIQPKKKAELGKCFLRMVPEWASPDLDCGPASTWAAASLPTLPFFLIIYLHINIVPIEMSL